MEKIVLNKNIPDPLAQLFQALDAGQISFDLPERYMAFHNPVLHLLAVAFNHHLPFGRAVELLNEVFRQFQIYKTDDELCLIQAERPHQYFIYSQLTDGTAYPIAEVTFLVTDNSTALVSGIQINRADNSEGVTDRDRVRAFYTFELLTRLLRSSGDK
jgi:hypothetical protein